MKMNALDYMIKPLKKGAPGEAVRPAFKEKIPDFQSVHREITAITVMMNWCILKPGSTGYMAGEKTEGSLNVPKILAGSKNS